MIDNLVSIKAGLALVMLGLLFGIGLGVTFGVNEAFFETYVAQGIAVIFPRNSRHLERRKSII